jgi:hypothetical protein
MATLALPSFLRAQFIHTPNSNSRVNFINLDLFLIIQYGFELG